MGIVRLANPDLNVLTDTEAAYLAGFVDGEAHLTVRKRVHYKGNLNFSCAFQIVNTNLEFVTWLESKVSFRRAQREPDRYMNSRTCYTCNFSRHEMRIVLPLLLPYLIVKHRLAELVLEYLTLCDVLSSRGDKSKFELIADECSSLTARGYVANGL